ncbi:hypothetical protein EBZ02_04610 [bacterium]|nr:hypothetical protein [bacterium]NDA09955.1 hypothetical protein [Verrucomicrobiota bacterium]
MRTVEIDISREKVSEVPKAQSHVTLKTNFICECPVCIGCSNCALLTQFGIVRKHDRAVTKRVRRAIPKLAGLDHHVSTDGVATIKNNHPPEACFAYDQIRVLRGEFALNIYAAGGSVIVVSEH